MNTLFLVAATVVAFAFGYRFYAKLLALEVFRLDANYSTPAQSRPDGRDYVPTHRHLLIGHHIAAVTGAGAFAAPVLALDWGWIPAFLWIVVGSTVAAGTYAIGSFWLSSRFAGELGQTARTLIGASSRNVMRILTVAVLIMLVGATASLSASLFVAFPEAVLPTGAVVLGAWIFGHYLHGRAQSHLLPAAVVSLAAVILLTEWLGGVPVKIGGALAIDIGASAHLSINAVLVWTAVLLAYAFASARLPVWKLSRPRGFLMAMMTGALLILFLAALVVQHPTIDAPPFHAPSTGGGALPWLFLAVGTGALAGWHLLIANAVTGRELQREPDARYVGYGVVMFQGAIAVSALLLAAAAFSDRGNLLANRSVIDAVDFPLAASFYAERYVSLVGALGLDAALVRPLVATVLAGLSLAVLEAAVRALMNGLIEIFPPAPAISGQRDGRRIRLWIAVLAGAAVALHDGSGLGGLKIWPLLALTSIWIAAIGFAMIALALQRAHQPAQVPTALAAVVAAIALWSAGAQLWRWWESESWAFFVGGALATLLAGSMLVGAVISGRRAMPSSPDTAPYA